jgi:hypothetical protein
MVDFDTSDVEPSDSATNAAFLYMFLAFMSNSWKKNDVL